MLRQTLKLGLGAHQFSPAERRYYVGEPLCRLADNSYRSLDRALEEKSPNRWIERNTGRRFCGTFHEHISGISGDAAVIETHSANPVFDVNANVELPYIQMLTGGIGNGHGVNTLSRSLPRAEDRPNSEFRHRWRPDYVPAGRSGCSE